MVPSSLYVWDETADAFVPLGSTGGAAHVIHGIGGTAGTDVTAWPLTMGALTTAGEETSVYNLPSGYVTFQATGDDNGGTLSSATILIWVSNDNVAFIQLGSISITTDGTTDGFASNAPWAYVKAELDTISESGSTPTVTVTMGA